MHVEKHYTYVFSFFCREEVFRKVLFVEPVIGSVSAHVLEISTTADGARGPCDYPDFPRLCAIVFLIYYANRLLFLILNVLSRAD